MVPNYCKLGTKKFTPWYQKNLEQMDAMEASLRRIEGALTRARDDDEATPVGSVAKRTRVD